MKMYYSDKIALLKDIFGTDHCELKDDRLVISGKEFPIINDVIILLEPSKWPATLRKKVQIGKTDNSEFISDFAEDIQFTFGAEWVKYPHILAEHEKEFLLNFELIDLSSLKNSRVCDLGCGIGRWSYFLYDKCRELVMIDFSEAIFVARENLRKSDNTVFIMGDLTNLPLKEKFADFLFCIGVLHHLPFNALDMVRKLKKYSSQILIYLYYSLDNRPWFHRVLLSIVTAVRSLVTKIRAPVFRSIFVELVAILVYCPFILLGKIFNLFGWAHYIPLEYYKGMSLKRIRQDVYDRFFTRIEQRFSRKEIMVLRDTFKDVKVSENLPYWHFLCID
ncbi:MAG: class I SAM-dependent methyltransferase [Candidatus Omnitrophica bacterium]|nr:class I SAM-dependent methyltransferase [Candidatus Omnitrophota bacterium]